MVTSQVACCCVCCYSEKPGSNWDVFVLSKPSSGTKCFAESFLGNILCTKPSIITDPRPKQNSSNVVSNSVYKTFIDNGKCLLITPDGQINIQRISIFESKLITNIFNTTAYLTRNPIPLWHLKY